MAKVKITYVDHVEETVTCERVVVDNGVLKCRTSHASAYVDTYKNFPLVNILSWETL